MDVHFGQNSFSSFILWKDHKRPVGFTVLYQYLLDKDVCTTRKFCSVACYCIEKAMQNVAKDVHLVYLQPLPINVKFAYAHGRNHSFDFSSLETATN